MGSSTPTPTVAGGTIDNESLRRQKEEMGQALNRAQRANSRVHQANGSTPVPSSTAVSVRRSISIITEPQDTVMSDTNGPDTPKVQDTVRKSSQTPGVAQLPTPAMEVDPQDPTKPLTNGIHNHEPSGTPPTGHATNAVMQSQSPLERKARDPGKGKALSLFVLSFLTCSRPYHCSSRLGDFHDES